MFCDIKTYVTRIREAERHWKKIKSKKQGKQGNLSIDKVKLVSSITAASSIRAYG